MNESVAEERAEAGVPDEPFGQLAAALADPPDDPVERAALLDAAAQELRSALGALDGV